MNKFQKNIVACLLTFAAGATLMVATYVAASHQGHNGWMPVGREHLVLAVSTVFFTIAGILMVVGGGALCQSLSDRRFERRIATVFPHTFPARSGR